MHMWVRSPGEEAVAPALSGRCAGDAPGQEQRKEQSAEWRAVRVLSRSVGKHTMQCGDGGCACKEGEERGQVTISDQLHTLGIAISLVPAGRCAIIYYLWWGRCRLATLEQPFFHFWAVTTSPARLGFG